MGNVDPSYYAEAFDSGSKIQREVEVGAHSDAAEATLDRVEVVPAMYASSTSFTATSTPSISFGAVYDPVAYAK